MSREDLRRQLEQLQSELANTSSRDPRTREMLERLQADVRGALADDSADTSSLRAKLEDAVAHFEATHPDLARTLAQVIDALALWGL
jgi:ABC-type transporter Mla subunit MlaD